jgi:plasmid maintenance system antidote protein VapI
MLGVPKQRCIITVQSRMLRNMIHEVQAIAAKSAIRLTTIFQISF